MTQLPAEKACGGPHLGGPIDWVQDLWAARETRQEVEAVLRKEQEAEDRARQGMSWSQKADVFLSVVKIGLITVPIALLGLSVAPALRGAGEALRGGGAAAAEGAKTLKAFNSLRQNPAPLSWARKREHLLAMKARYWKLADVPSLSKGGGTLEQWFLQGVGQGINDACIVRENCFRPNLFTEVLRNRKALEREAARRGDEKEEVYHRGFYAGMKAAIQYLSEPAYGPPQATNQEDL